MNEQIPDNLNIASRRGRGANHGGPVKLAIAATVSLLAISASASFLLEQSQGPDVEAASRPTEVSPALNPEPADNAEAPANSTQASSMTDYTAALAMWRAPRPKDACMSCHGPDFFDLARIGSSDDDIIRRSIIDGANEDEAEALVRGVQFLRTQYNLKPENPRTFRPFQPGGAVLPGSTSLERDNAFGAELEKVLPTLASSKPIRTIEDAIKARNELLAVDFDKLRIGIQLPLWSADIHHGEHEGTLNDWIADLPRVPKPHKRAEWIKIQDAYLANPNDTNFWRLYFSVEEMTDAFTPVTVFDPTDGWKAPLLQLMKYKSVLLGQHALRAEALGRSDFFRGQIKLAYMAKEEPTRSTYVGKYPTIPGPNDFRFPAFLPNPWWEVGDMTRVSLALSPLARAQFAQKANTPIREIMKLGGYPDFAVESVSPSTTNGRMGFQMQLEWFALGMVLDPSLQRINSMPATNRGEYFQQRMWNQDLYIHRLFQAAMRKVLSSYSADARTAGSSAPYRLEFQYFTGQDREQVRIINQPENRALSPEIRAVHKQRYDRMLANFFRMSLLLHEQELDAGRIAPYGTSSQDGYYEPIHRFFNYAGLPGRSEDDFILRRVAAKSQTPLSF